MSLDGAEDPPSAPSTLPSQGPPEDVHAPRRVLPATFRSLRHRNYRLYFFAQLISWTGTWIQTTALAWVAFDLTGQSMGPALVTVTQGVPTFLLGVWGGALADRWPKRSLLLVTQTGLLLSAVALAVLVALGTRSLWPLLLVTTASGVVSAIDLPARLAFVMEMVGRDDLINAVALNSVQFNVARAVGPALGGWLLAGLGPELCFLVNALSFVAVVWALSRMTESPHAARAPGGGRPGAFFDGFAFLARQPGLALLVMLAGILALTGWPFLSLLPALADHTLGVGVRGYSRMLSATGFGALAAAVAVATFGSLPRGRAFLGAGAGLFSAGLIGLSLARDLLVAVPSCALIGFGLIIFFATCQSVVQLSAGDHNRGRVMGIWAMVMSGAIPAGNLLAFPAADHWGEPLVLLWGGVASAAAGIVILVVFPLSNRLRRHSA